MVSIEKNKLKFASKIRGCFCKVQMKFYGESFVCINEEWLKFHVQEKSAFNLILDADVSIPDDAKYVLIQFVTKSGKVVDEQLHQV